MNHTVQIIETKQLSDGEFAILSQCCDDPMTKSWGTMAAATCSDPTKYQSFVDYHHNRIAVLHNLALQSKVVLANLQGATYTITVPDPAPAPADPAPADPAPTAPTDPSAPAAPSDPSSGTSTTPPSDPGTTNPGA